MFKEARVLLLVTVTLLICWPNILPSQATEKPLTDDRQAYPAPRYPAVPNITTVDQLLPYVRRIVERPMPYTGDQRPGYGIKGGEKVLFVTDSDVDPLVIEAFL
ncbi:MAG TPA: hypothetical protein VFQ92_12890, partial [Blastocatellia bacterium]|nr:hypothetical protein [Blastocatellia bacterium]